MGGSAGDDEARDLGQRSDLLRDQVGPAVPGPLADGGGEGDGYAPPSMPPPTLCNESPWDLSLWYRPCDDPGRLYSVTLRWILPSSWPVGWVEWGRGEWLL